MDSGMVVVDISSDDEADDHIYLNSVEKSGSERTKSGAARGVVDDDCMILDGDPDKPVADEDDKRDGGESGDGSDDLCIVGQKGQVACRDFPHSRHLCANFPFSTTSHKQHCKLCHCFVCDSPAPCIYWGNGASFTDHCHATDKEDKWKVERRSFKKLNTASLHPKQLHPKQLHAVKHTVTQHIQNPTRIFNRVPVPAPTPVQPFKSGSLHHCSNTNSSTTYVPALRPHQHPVCYRRQTPTEQSQRSQPAHGVIRAGLALAAASHAQYKRVGATGSVVIRPTVTRPQHTSPCPNQMLSMPLTPRHQPATSLGHQQHPRHQLLTSIGPQQRLVPLPRSQSMPVQRSLHDQVTTQVCLKTVTPSPEEDSVKQWQDILAGVAAELGVSDGISKNTVASQPYVPSSQSLPFDTHIEFPVNANQGMGMHADLGPATALSNPACFDPAWLDTSLGQNYNRGSQGGDTGIATLHPSGSLDSVNNEAVSVDLHLDSFLASVGETASAAGKEQGLLPEVDPGLFLYDIDCGWD